MLCRIFLKLTCNLVHLFVFLSLSLNLYFKCRMHTALSKCDIPQDYCKLYNYETKRYPGKPKHIYLICVFNCIYCIADNVTCFLSIIIVRFIKFLSFIVSKHQQEMIQLFKNKCSFMCNNSYEESNNAFTHTRMYCRPCNTEYYQGKIYAKKNPLFGVFFRNLL